MKRLAIVYHSQSGATKRLAQAAARGAEAEDGVIVRCEMAMESGAELLLWADAVLFGSPENLGYLSGGMKDFFDRTFYAVADKLQPLPYAAFFSAGNDGRNAAKQLQRIVSGYAMRAVADPVIVRGDPDVDGLARVEELGQTLAAGLVMGIF